MKLKEQLDVLFCMISGARYTGVRISGACNLIDPISIRLNDTQSNNADIAPLCDCEVVNVTVMRDIEVERLYKHKGSSNWESFPGFNIIISDFATKETQGGGIQ